MAVIELTKENFEPTVSDPTHKMVIVDFWAPWCGPCRTFAPVFEQVSKQYPDIVFGKVNTEEQQELAGYFQIRSIPTLMVLRESVILHSQAGALPANQFTKLIEQMLAVNMAEVHQQIAEHQAQEAASKAS